MDAKSSQGGIGQRSEDYSTIIKEVNEKLSKKSSPLKAMETLAKNLPAGTYITRMVLNDNRLEVSVSSKDPLSVVKALGSAEGIKTVRLKGATGKGTPAKGAPAKGDATESYNFNVIIELSK